MNDCGRVTRRSNRDPCDATSHSVTVSRPHVPTRCSDRWGWLVPIFKHLRPKLQSVAPPSQASWADQQDCQNVLVEDHSGGYRIETHRPGGVLVGQRRFEVRAEDARQHPGEVRQVELQESVSMEATEPTACRVGNPRLVAATPYAGWL